MPIAQSQDNVKQSDDYKTERNALIELVKEQPYIKLSEDHKTRYRAKLITGQLLKKFDARMAQLGDAPGAALDTAEELRIELEQRMKNPNDSWYIDPKDGSFPNFAANSKAGAEGLATRTAQRNEVYRRSASELNALGVGALDKPNALLTKAHLEAEAVGFGQDPNWSPSHLSHYISGLLNISPLELINRQRKAVELPELKVPPVIEQQQREVNPKLQQLINRYQTHNRLHRALYPSQSYGDPNSFRSSIVPANQRVARFRAAIIGKESGGSYSAVNPHSGALGIGQVMPDNVPSWSAKYYGRSVTPEEFLKNRGVQDAVINGKFNEILEQQLSAGYSEEEAVRRAASIWYSGDANLWNSTKPEYYEGHRYPSIAEYTRDIWERYNRG